MPRLVALLRGINVGGHRVKMDRLRALFREMGFDEPSTFIASGNVIFSTGETDEAALAERIEEHLERSLGYGVRTFLRSPAELRRIAAHAPPGHRPGRSLYVIFLDAPADRAMRGRFAGVETEADRFTFDGREIYWSIDGKLSDSPLFGAGIEKTLAGAGSTTRAATSLAKLVAKLG